MTQRRLKPSVVYTAALLTVVVGAAGIGVLAVGVLAWQGRPCPAVGACTKPAWVATLETLAAALAVGTGGGALATGYLLGRFVRERREVAIPSLEDDRRELLTFVAGVVAIGALGAGVGLLTAAEIAYRGDPATVIDTQCRAAGECKPAWVTGVEQAATVLAGVLGASIVSAVEIRHRPFRDGGGIGVIDVVTFRRLLLVCMAAAAAAVISTEVYGLTRTVLRVPVPAAASYVVWVVWSARRDAATP